MYFNKTKVVSLVTIKTFKFYGNSCHAHAANEQRKTKMECLDDDTAKLPRKNSRLFYQTGTKAFMTKLTQVGTKCGTLKHISTTNSSFTYNFNRIPETKAPNDKIPLAARDKEFVIGR